MTLSAEEQKAFNEALAASKEEINNFYKEDVYQTHYILFVEYLRLSRIIANLKDVDYDSEKIEKIAEYVFEYMPQKETLANVMTPEYFPDFPEMENLLQMTPEDLEQEKQKLFNETGLWNI